MGHFLLLPHRDARCRRPRALRCACIHAPLSPLCPSACVTPPSARMTPPPASAPASPGILSFRVTLVNLTDNVFENMIFFLFCVCPASPTDPRTECLLFLCTCQSSFGDCLRGGPPTTPPVPPSSKSCLPPQESDLRGICLDQKKVAEAPLYQFWDRVLRGLSVPAFILLEVSCHAKQLRAAQ